jgi:hypothetical protein
MDRKAAKIFKTVATLVICLVVTPAAGASPTTLPATWQTDLAEASHDAVAAGDRLVIATEAGVHAFGSGDGKRLWTTPLPGARSLSTDGSSVWVTAPARLVRLSARTGKQVAEKELPIREAVLAPEPVRGTLLVGDEDQTILIRAKNLDELRRLDEPLFHDQTRFLRQSGHWRLRFAEDGRRIHFVERGKLLAVATGSGKTVYEVAVPPRSPGLPTVWDDQIYFVSPNRLNCYNLKKGDKLLEKRLRTANPPEPFILAQRSDVPAARHVKWWRRPMVWGREIYNRFFPQRVALRYADGLLFQPTKPSGEQLYHPLPGDALPLAHIDRSTLFLLKYVDEQDGQTKSVLMRWHRGTAQLYGRSPFAGEASGLFALTATHVYAEMSPGLIVEFDLAELEPQRLFSIGAESLEALAVADGKLVALTSAGRIAALTMK